MIQDLESQLQKYDKELKEANGALDQVNSNLKAKKKNVEYLEEQLRLLNLEQANLHGVIHQNTQEFFFANQCVSHNDILQQINIPVNVIFKVEKIFLM
jgi:chromosome segregation ATPase